jgi:hypothetical protein
LKPKTNEDRLVEISVQGAVTVGVEVHSIRHTAGHGPGVRTIFASAEGEIKPAVGKDANLKFILGLK